MNTDEARYVLAIYRHGSLTQAADELHISPQGLSLSLKRFEAKLGVKLFARSPQGMKPTEHVNQLLGSFERMIAAEDEAYAYLSDLKQSSRMRYLLARDSMLGDTVAQGVQDYNLMRGEEAVQVVMMRETEDRLARIFLDGGYDYRVLSSEIDDLQNLPHADIGIMRFIPLVNSKSEAAIRGSLTFEDLRKHTLLAEYRSFAWVRILEQHCRRLGFTPRIREVDKDYIARLLQGAGNEVVYMRELDLNHAPWNSAEYCVPESYEPLEAHIILQSTDATIDHDLVACLRKSFAQSPYAQESGHND